MNYTQHHLVLFLLPGSSDDIPTSTFYPKTTSNRHSLDSMKSSHKDKNKKKKRRQTITAITMRNLHTLSRATPVKANPSMANDTSVKSPNQSLGKSTPKHSPSLKKSLGTKRSISTPVAPISKRARLVCTPEPNRMPKVGMGNAVAMRAILGKEATPKLPQLSKNTPKQQIRSGRKKTPGAKSWADVARCGIVIKGALFGKKQSTKKVPTKKKRNKAPSSRTLPVRLIQIFKKLCDWCGFYFESWS